MSQGTRSQTQRSRNTSSLNQDESEVLRSDVADDLGRRSPATAGSTTLVPGSEGPLQSPPTGFSWVGAAPSSQLHRMFPVAGSLTIGQQLSPQPSESVNLADTPQLGIPAPGSPGVIPPPNSIVPDRESPASGIEAVGPTGVTDNQVQDPFDRMARAIAETLTTFAANRPPLLPTQSELEIDASGKGPSARTPDRFDGTRASALRVWLTQLTLIFLNHPGRFRSDRSKVLFAGSYLSGVASDWFQPIIEEGSTNPDRKLLDDWNLFVDRITAVFGDPNAEATAEHNLSMLQMRDTENIAEYITRFRTEAARVNWDDAALKFRFRRGLCSRILDDLSKVPDQPDCLTSLIETSLTLDNRYWERVRERRFQHPTRHVPQLHAPVRTPIRRPTLPRLNDQLGRDFPRPPANAHNASTPGKSYRNPTTVPSGRTGLDRILTSEGKLTEAEKKRRADRGLCTYCGGPHKLDNCPSRPQSSSSAPVASTSSNPIAWRGTPLKVPVKPRSNRKN